MRGRRRIDQENYALKNVCEAVNATKAKMATTHPMAFKMLFSVP